MVVMAAGGGISRLGPEEAADDSGVGSEPGVLQVDSGVAAARESCVAD